METKVIKDRNTFIKKVYIFMVVYLSGTIFCTSYYYSQSVVAGFVCTVFITLIISAKHEGKIQIDLKKIAILCILAMFICIVVLLNESISLSSYIAIILQLIMSMLVVKTFPVTEFKRIYVSVMSFICVVALICYTVFFVQPSIALSFPRVEGIADLDYYFAGVYVFPSVHGYGYFIPFYRNCSIFWEPGVFQAFVNIALLFLLKEKQYGFSKGDLFKTSVFILAVITTFSTTGYILLILILIRYRKSLFTSEHNVIAFLAFLIVIIVGLQIISKTGMFGFLSTKLNREFGQNRTFVDRLRIEDLKLFGKYPRSFFGISFENYAQDASGTGNSLIHTALTLGIPFTSILLILYYSFSKKSGDSFFWFLILMMIFSTESLIWRPFFLCLAWYGIGRSTYKNERVAQIEDIMGG